MALCGAWALLFGGACAEPAHAHEDAPTVTLAAPAAVSEPVTVAVVSDLNGPYGSTHYTDNVREAIGAIVRRDPDLVLSTGDMVAGQRAGLDYGAMWHGFHGAVTHPLSRASIPFAPVPGNHDASAYPIFASERAEYVEQWRHRTPSGGSGPTGLTMRDATHFPLRYSFTMGPAFFVGLDATTTQPLSPAQMRWLDRELARARHYPVKVVFAHVPLYPFAVGREGDHIGDTSLERLLRRHSVSLMISGHHHAYYPGRRGALRLVSMACLGAGPRRLLAPGVESESARSVVFFSFDESGIVSLEARRGRDLSRVIRRRRLPPRVGMARRWIGRDDTEASYHLR